MKFKVGDSVKYVGTYYNFNGYEGVVTEVLNSLVEFPISVLFTHADDLVTWPCGPEELELVHV